MTRTYNICVCKTHLLNAHVQFKEIKLGKNKMYKTKMDSIKINQCSIYKTLLKQYY